MAKNETDMIEVDTTYFWQIPHVVDAGVLRASVPASLPRTQFEFGLAWANEMSTSKQAIVQPVLDIRSDGLFHFSARLIQTTFRKSFHIIVSLSYPGKEHLLCSVFFVFKHF